MSAYAISEVTILDHEAVARYKPLALSLAGNALQRRLFIVDCA